MANLELNQTIRTILPSAGGLFGVDSASDAAPAPYGPLAIARAASKPYAAVTLSGQAYTTVAGDLGKTLDVTSGASDATITVMSAATAGAGAEMMIRKSDSAMGLVIVMEGASTLCWLQAVNDLVWLKSTGAAWEIVQQISYTPLDGPSYVDGRYYPCFEIAATSAVAPPKDFIYLTPFALREAVKIQKLGLRVGGGQTGGKFKCGLWRSGPSGAATTAAIGRPYGAPLIAINTEQPADANADVFASITPLWLPPGVYWGGVKLTATSTMPTVTTVGFVSNGNRILSMIGGSAGAVISVGNLRGLSYADDFANNLPTFNGASFVEMTSGNMPGVIFQAGG